MFANTASLAHARQFTGPAHPLNDGVSLVQEITTARAVRRRGAMATIPMSGTANAIRTTRDRRSFKSGRYFPLEYGGGRRPVPCGHGADLDIRNGLCYRTGTVPRQYQDARQGYRYRRNGGYEMR